MIFIGSRLRLGPRSRLGDSRRAWNRRLWKTLRTSSNLMRIVVSSWSWLRDCRGVSLSGARGARRSVPCHTLVIVVRSLLSDLGKLGLRKVRVGILIEGTERLRRRRRTRSAESLSRIVCPESYVLRLIIRALIWRHVGGSRWSCRRLKGTTELWWIVLMSGIYFLPLLSIQVRVESSCFSSGSLKTVWCVTIDVTWLLPLRRRFVWRVKSGWRFAGWTASICR